MSGHIGISAFQRRELPGIHSSTAFWVTSLSSERASEIFPFLFWLYNTPISNSTNRQLGQGHSMLEVPEHAKSCRRVRFGKLT